MDLLALSSSAGGNCVRGVRNIWGDTKLSGFRAMAREVADSGTKVQAEASVPLLSHPSLQPADAGAINLDKAGHSAQGIP